MASIKNIKVAALGTFALLFFIWLVSGSLSAAIGETGVDQTDDVNVAATPTPNSYSDEYVGTETCKACHESQFKSFSLTVHGKISDAKNWKDKVQGCESCHGPGKAHSEDGDITKIKKLTKMKAEEANQTCMACHSQIGTHADWRGSKHESAGLSCVNCHSAHPPSVAQTSDLRKFANLQSETKLLKKRTEAETCYQCHSDIRKSESQRSTHLYKNEDREATTSCSSCHDAHGSSGEKLMKTASINDTCYTCHAEKRGPFLWEHSPARENCMTCHKAHGSNHTSLLKARAPMLCQQCHMQGRHQTIAGKPNSMIMINRGCLNCHSQVHGSNHPSGINLQR